MSYRKRYSGEKIISILKKRGDRQKLSGKTAVKIVSIAKHW